MSIALILFVLRTSKKRLASIAVVVFMSCIAINCCAAAAQEIDLGTEEYQLAAGYYQQSEWAKCAVALEEFMVRHPSHQKFAEANFFLAESKIQLGNFADALISLQKFVAENPNHALAPRATFRMGESAYHLDKGKIALKSLELFVKKYPKHRLVEYALPYLGELRLKFNEAGLARRAFSTALRLYPESSMSDQSRFGLARSLQQLGKVDIAKRYWEFLASSNHSPYQALSKLELGIVACESKEYETAKQYLAAAEATLIDNVERKIEASYWLGRIALEENEFEKANSIFTSLKLLPSDENLGAGICHDAAIAAWKTGKNDLAIEWLTKLRSTWPDNQVSASALALEIKLLRERGLDVIALDFCNRFADRFPDSDLRFGVAGTAGRILHGQKKYAVAVATFEKLLQEHAEFNEGKTATPESRKQRANWLYLKGLCHIGLEEFDTALQDLKLADANELTADENPQITLAMATALFGQQFYAQAVTKFERFVAKANRGERTNISSTLSRMVVCYGQLDRWDDADQSLALLLQRDGATAIEATQFLADHAYDKQRYDIATRYYQQLAAPENANRYRNAGLKKLSWLMMESQTPEANEVFRRLLTEYPDSSFSTSAALSRAKYLEDHNDQISARSLYQAIVDQFSSFEVAQISRLRLAWFLQKDADRDSLQAAKRLIEQFLETAEATPETEDAKSLTLVGEALYQLGWVNRDLGNTDQADDAFGSLVAAHPDSKYWPDAAYRLAESMTQKGEYEHATAMVSRILNQESVPPEVKIQTLYLQSKIAAKGDRWADVPELMNQLIATSTDSSVIATANYWLAESLYRQNEFDAAAEVFDQLQPDANLLGESLEPWMLLRLAQCHGKSQRWTNAAMIARDCLDRFSTFPHLHEFHFLLGRAAEYDGMFDDARSHYETVLNTAAAKQTETAAIAQWRIGETFFHQENYKLAIEAYFKVASEYTLEKWNSAALIQAGKCQEHLGNWRHAEKLYSQLIEQYPESEFSEDASQRRVRVSELQNQQPSGTTTR